MKTLSIRQPWAWLIVNGHKDIENRSRNIGGHLGPILIHASATMTKTDYIACTIFIGGIWDELPSRFELPDYDDLKTQCGGIVGQTYIRGHGNMPMTSPWYTNAGYSYGLEQSKPLPFHPCKGKQGFFNVELPKA